MREIKFRAWNTREQYMTLEALGLNGEGTQRFQSLTHNSLNLETGEIVWMQFTGLKDKNGKEIYAHDLVAIEIDTEFGKMRVMGEVVYHIAAWCERVLNNYDEEKPFYEFEVMNIMV
jgi:uncharacterized phage protein (TIGR01671 family)